MILTGTTFSIRSSSGTAAVAEAARPATGSAQTASYVPTSIPVVNFAPATAAAVDLANASLEPIGSGDSSSASGAQSNGSGGTQTAMAVPAGSNTNASIDTDLAPASRPLDSRVVTAKRGDTLMDILVRAGVSNDDAENAISSLREVYDPRDLKAGQDVTLVFGPASGTAQQADAKINSTSKTSESKTAAKKQPGDLLALRLQPDAKREVGTRRADQGGFSATQRQKELTSKEVRAAGKIDSSLFDAAQTAGVPSKVLAEMIHAFSYDVDFQRDIQPGDTFELVYDAKLDDKGNVVETGQLRYAQMVLSGNRLPLYLYTTKDGDTDYYNARGESVHKALMRTPVDGARLSSTFGQRKHPILGYTRMHRGVDFAAPTGTPIMAAGSGVVVMAHRNKGYGNYIEIRHDPDFDTAYGHLSRYAKGIHAGVRVKQGEIIGYVGMTGLATGPHLHFEVIHDGQKVNPLSVNLPSGRKLKGRELEQFLASKGQVDTLVAQLAANPEVASTR